MKLKEMLENYSNKLKLEKEFQQLKNKMEEIHRELRRTDEGILSLIIDHYRTCRIYYKHDALTGDLSEYKGVQDKSKIRPIEELFNKRFLIKEGHTYVIKKFEDIPEFKKEKLHVNAILIDSNTLVCDFPLNGYNQNFLSTNIFGDRSDILTIKNLEVVKIPGIDGDILELAFNKQLVSNINGKVFDKRNYNYFVGVEELIKYGEKNNKTYYEAQVPAPIAPL